MINLDELMYKQARLLRSMGWPGGKPIIDMGNEEAAKGHLLAAMVECTEALNELNWEPWKSTCSEVDRVKYATELMDIVQFVCNAALAMGLDEIDLERAIRDKWQENQRRIDAGEVTCLVKK